MKMHEKGVMKEALAEKAEEERKNDEEESITSAVEEAKKKAKEMVSHLHRSLRVQHMLLLRLPPAFG